MAKKLGMVKVRGNLCRTKAGKFTKCRGKISKGKGSGFKKRHAKSKLKGRCLKWSKGGSTKRRCLKRAKR